MPRPTRLALCLGLALGAPLALLGSPAVAAPSPGAPYDVDGNGFPDLVVGATGLRVGSVRGAGGVVVLPASAKGLSSKERVVTQSSRGAPGASESGDAFGAAVASGDFDADGFADLAIGQPGETVGSTVAAGAVTVVYGSASGLDTRRSTSFTFPGAGLLGAALVAADLTGDGVRDLAVGSPGEDFGDAPDGGTPVGGVVHVLRGGSSGLTASNQIELRGDRTAGTGDVGFGARLAAADLDLDGRADLVVGSRGRVYDEGGAPGSVSVCRGSVSVSAGCARVLHAKEIAGATALAVGDVTGDARPEIVVGSGRYVDGDPGRVELLQLPGGLSASASRTEITQASPGVPGSDETNDGFGASVVVGDLDGDGFDDLVVGSPGEDANRGRITVIGGAASGGYARSGNISLDQSTKGIPGKAEKGDRFGSDLALSDHDQDGDLDLAVGATGENSTDGSVTTIDGDDGRAKAYSLDSLGYAHPKDAAFGGPLG